MRTLGRIPRELLSGGRAAFTVRTPISFGPQPQIHRPSQNRQVSKREGFIHAMQVRNLMPTLAAACSFQQTFDHDRVLASLVLLHASDLHVRNIQGNSNVGGNGYPLLSAVRSDESFLSTSLPHHNILWSLRQVSKSRLLPHSGA